MLLRNAYSASVFKSEIYIRNIFHIVLMYFLLEIIKHFKHCYDSSDGSPSDSSLSFRELLLLLRFLYIYLISSHEQKHMSRSHMYCTLFIFFSLRHIKLWLIFLSNIHHVILAWVEDHDFWDNWSCSIL